MYEKDYVFVWFVGPLQTWCDAKLPFSLFLALEVTSLCNHENLRYSSHAIICLHVSFHSDIVCVYILVYEYIVLALYAIMMESCFFPTELISSISEVGSSTGCSDGCGNTSDVETSSDEDDEPP